MKPAFVKSYETTYLVKLFIGVSIDAPMSFDQASKLAGFKVYATLSAYQSARRIAERDHHIVIDGIRGFGFVRLTGEKISEAGERDLTSIRRRARRGAHKQEVAISQNLDQRHMLRSTELLSRLRIVADTAAPARSNRIMTPEPIPAEPVDNRMRLVKATG